MFANIINKIKTNISISWAVYIFLGMLAFNFADNIIVFASLALVANTLLLIFSKRKFNSEFLLTLLLCVIPLVGLALFSLTSKFNLDIDSNYSLVKYMFLIAAFIAVPFLGFQSRECEKFDIKVALKVIYILLGLWMLINFFITLIQFGPFYTFIYNNRYFFDYGHIARLPVNKMAYMLLGFKVEVVNAELFALVASVLSSAILGVFFVSFKEDKCGFLVYLITGFVGLLCLIFTLNKTFIIGYFALVIAFTLIVLFAKKIIPWNKITKIVIFSIIGLIGLYFLLVMLSGFKLLHLENTSFFFNKLTRKYHNFIRAMVDHKTYNGFTGYLLGQDNLKFTGSWMFDMFAIVGVFGWVAFLIFVVVMFIRYVNYFKSSNDDFSSKVIILGIILGLLLFSGASYDSMPYFENALYVPMFFLSPFIILLFIYGYIGKNEEAIKV